MHRLDFAPRQRVEAIQADKLRRLLRHAAAVVPYYRELFTSLGVDPNIDEPLVVLSQLPPLTKPDIEANFPDRIIAGGRRGVGARHVTTSGTTSDRIEVVLSLRAQHWRHAQQLWADDVGGGCAPGLRRLEIPPDACSRVCGQNDDRPEGLWAEMRWAAERGPRPSRAVADVVARRMRDAVRRRILNDTTLPPLLGPGGTAAAATAVEHHVDVIERERPYLLTGLPTYLQEIARHVRRAGRRLHVPVVRPIGAVSSPRMKQFIAESLRAEVLETYGSNELGCVASECRCRRGMHVAMGCFVVEVLRDGRPAQPGELGRLVITGLDNLAMPLIRYDLGDVGRFYQEPCECGRTTQRIECEGRLQALVVTSAGRPVTEQEIMDVAYFDLGLEHFQLIEHRPGEFDLLIVPAPDTSPDIQAVRASFARLLDQPRQLDVFPVETIYPEATGKFRFIKSASYDRFK